MNVLIMQKWDIRLLLLCLTRKFVSSLISFASPAKFVPLLLHVSVGHPSRDINPPKASTIVKSVISYR